MTIQGHRARPAVRFAAFAGTSGVASLGAFMGASVRRSMSGLVVATVAIALGGCTTPPDPRPFADATAALASAVKTSGQAVESQLRSSSIPSAPVHADALHEQWATRIAVMEQTVAYADGLREVYDAAANSNKLAHQIAADVSSIASAAGIVLPTSGAVSGGIDLAAIVYQNINNAKAASTIADSLQYADKALAGISHSLDRDSIKLREILELAHAEARSQGVLADKNLDLNYEQARDEASKLMGRLPSLNADELGRLAALNALADSHNARIAQREKRLAEIDSRFAAQAALIDAANAAMSDWSAAHSRLAAAVREHRAVSVESLVQTTAELRELIRKVRDQ